MKLQIALRFLVLLTALVAFTLASDGGDVAGRRGACSASSPRITEMKSEGLELAAGGIQVGQMAA